MSEVKDNANIKLMFGVILTVVTIVGWGISIGINYQRMNGLEKSSEKYQGATDTRIEKLEQTVRTGMDLRIRLEEAVKTLQVTANSNSTKLDEVLQSLNEHKLQSKDKSVMSYTPDSKEDAIKIR
jgi:hypothetical protein